MPTNNQDVQGYITNQSPESIVEEAQGKLTELEQRIKEAIEKNAQLQSLELAHADQLTKEKIEELNKTREEQIQKKQKILEELQKVERELQLKTQQQLKKQYLEVKAQRIQLQQQQQQQQSCQHLGLLTPVGVGEQLSEGDYARLQQVDPILLKDDPQQAAAQTGFAPVQPLAMPQALPLAAGSLPPGSIANLTELQGVIVGQPVLGQAQLAGLGQGILTETQQGLMVASPAQTLNDTLDDIMAGGFTLLWAGIIFAWPVEGMSTSFYMCMCVCVFVYSHELYGKHHSSSDPYLKELGKVAFNFSVCRVSWAVPVGQVGMVEWHF